MSPTEEKNSRCLKKSEGCRMPSYRLLIQSNGELFALLDKDFAQDGDNFATV